MQGVINFAPSNFNIFGGCLIVSHQLQLIGICIISFPLIQTPSMNNSYSNMVISPYNSNERYYLDLKCINWHFQFTKKSHVCINMIVLCQLFRFVYFSLLLRKISTWKRIILSLFTPEPSSEKLQIFIWIFIVFFLCRAFPSRWGYIFLSWGPKGCYKAHR